MDVEEIVELVDGVTFVVDVDIDVDEIVVLPVVVDVDKVMIS